MNVGMKINLVEMYEDIYKGKKSPIPCDTCVTYCGQFQDFRPDRDFFTHPTLFTGVILVYNS